MLTDQTGMAEWAPVVSRELERSVDARGVGAVRALSGPPFTFREQITDVMETEQRLSYRLLSGAPVRNYSGETVLTGDDSTTDIVWTVRFRPGVPGMTAAIRWAIRKLTKGLAGQAEQVTGQSEAQR